MRTISYIRKVPGWTVDKQREAVGTVDAEYADATPEIALQSARRGDELRVAAARVLADNRDAIAHVIEEVNARGATLREMYTHRNSRDNGAGIMADAVAALANEARATGKRNGKAGSDVRWGKPKRMKKREALTIWRNEKHSVPEALALMDGWTQSTAYRLLGERGVPPGRR